MSSEDRLWIAVLIVFRITPLNEYFPLLQQHGLNIGIIILTIGVLTPIASGAIPGKDILKSFMVLTFIKGDSKL